MTSAGDGDGWVACELGHRHWGRYGAAGLLLYRRRADDEGVEVLLQHRADWSHHGGTWGVLGGARSSSEGAVEAALREAHEEAALSGQLTVDGRHDDAHGGWSYSTIIAQAAPSLVAEPASAETRDVQWWLIDDVPGLPLHPGLAASWPLLRETLHPWHIVIDAANVIGSRPDGWWRDRPGAAGRLARRCEILAQRGLPAREFDGLSPEQILSHRWPRWTMVVEGAARTAVAASHSAVRVVAAEGSGDDAVVVEVLATQGAPRLVVTADRALRARVSDAGAATVSPRWLLERLPPEG